MDLEPNGPATTEDVFARELVGVIPHLARTARAITGSAAAADDLVQETCRRALEARHTFEKSSNMRAWLLRILRNQHVDGIRHSAREVLKGHDIDVPAPEPDQPDLWRYIALEDVESACKQLPPAARKIYSLFVVERLSYRSISRQLGIPMTTVGTRLRRARISLRELVLEQIATGAERRSEQRIGTIAAERSRPVDDSPGGYPAFLASKVSKAMTSDRASPSLRTACVAAPPR